MTEQEAKDLRIGDVVEYDIDDAQPLIIIGTKKGYPPQAVDATWHRMANDPRPETRVVEEIEPARKWRIVSQVVSRGDGRPVDKL